MSLLYLFFRYVTFVGKKFGYIKSVDRTVYFSPKSVLDVVLEDLQLNFAVGDRVKWVKRDRIGSLKLIEIWLGINRGPKSWFNEAQFSRHNSENRKVHDFLWI